MRLSIADFEVVSPWGRDGRYICRAPARLNREGSVLVSELAIDADGWPQLCDTLVRLASVPGGGLLEVIEVGPDVETGAVFLATEAAEQSADLELGSVDDVSEGPRVAALATCARAVHAMHEVGLTHGSIYRERILHTERGPVLDLPRLDSPPGEITRIGPWSELVSCSPELLAGEPPSRSSDIWALGATLHNLLSERPLFPGVDSDEPVTALQRVMFTRPELDPTLPAELADLIEACLSTDPADRPPTARAVSDRLSRRNVSG